MELNDELSAIWLRQAVPVAPPEDRLLADAVAVKRKVYWKQGVAAVLLVVTLVVLNLWLVPVGPRLATTRIGIVLTNLAILVYLAASGDVIYLWLKKVRQDQSVKDALGEMILLKKRQHFLYGRLLGLYFILLFSGLMFYLWEFACQMGLIRGIAIYVLTSGWVVFAWFYIRPRSIKKYNEPVESVIREIRRVAGELPGNS